jgi:hypothetical protein
VFAVDDLLLCCFVVLLFIDCCLRCCLSLPVIDVVFAVAVVFAVVFAVYCCCLVAV